jgi:hypothetical protein
MKKWKKWIKTVMQEMFSDPMAASVELQAQNP